MVYANLAADRTVDLRQQCRGHMRQRDAPQISGGREACDVTHDSAADGDDGASPVRLAPDERLEDLCRGLKVLVPLSIRDQDDWGSSDGPLNSLSVMLPDDRARDDEPLGSYASGVEYLAQPIGEAFADLNRRRSGIDADVYAFGLGQAVVGWRHGAWMRGSGWAEQGPQPS